VGAFVLATIGIALALGHCEWWLRIHARLGSAPISTPPNAEWRDEAVSVPKRVEAWQRDEAARARLSELRSDSALVRGALTLVWPLLALMVALPVAALGVLLLPPDAMRTILAALLSASSIGLSFAFLISASRLYRGDNLSRMPGEEGVSPDR
jgi:hypothetical protein